MSEEPGEVCRELVTAFQQLLLEQPAVYRSGMAALRQILAGHGVELDLCRSEATFGAAGHHNTGLATSLAKHGIELAQDAELEQVGEQDGVCTGEQDRVCTRESWAVDLLGVAMVVGPAEAQGDKLGTIETVWDQGGLEREGCGVEVGVTGPPVAVPQTELAPEAEEGVEDEVGAGA